MLQSIATRLLLGLFALWLVSLAFFFTTDALPGDFASVNASRETTIEELDQARRERDLYLPVHVRYQFWLQQIVQGNLGRSWAYGRAISPILGYRLGNTFILALSVAVIALPIAFVLGIWSAIRLDTRTDRGISALSLVGVSIPEFVLAYTLMYLLSVKIPLLPAFTPFTRTLPLGDFAVGLILPVMILVITAVAPILRLTRASIVNVLNDPYIEMARQKGMRSSRVVLAHALPNAIGPIAQALALSFSNLLLGVVIIEYIFSYPGVGRLMVDAVQFRDAPMMMACTMVFALLYMLLNLGADIVSILSNPRLRFPVSSRDVGFRDFRLASRTLIGWAVSVLAIALITSYFLLRDPTVERPPVQAAQEEKWPRLFPAAGPTRTQLTLQQLRAFDDDSVTPLHHSHFLPVGEHAAAHEDFTGELRVPSFRVLRGQADQENSHYAWQFPGFRLRFSTDGNHLIPHERGMIGDDKKNRWKIIPGPGKMWSETTDSGWSRATFPFTLVNQRGGGGRNGVATFAYRSNKISNLRIQIAQEAAPGARIDVWGQADVFYLPHPANSRDAAIVRRFRVEKAKRFTVKPWDTLVQYTGAELLNTFDGRVRLDKIAQSGLLIDNTLYLRTCRTRLGPYPFCEEMRHSVYSVSKSMGALLSMLWLAREYGPQVFTERIVDYIPLTVRHRGWDNVTFGDALNMATGIGNLTPYDVRDEYIEVDGTRLANQIFNAETAADKLWLISEFKDYPWEPGEVFRYRTSDTFLLSAAMDAFVKSREGQHAKLWEKLHQKVFHPLGLANIPVSETLEANPREAVPRLGAGMLLTIHEIAQLARLLQNYGAHEGNQLLHRESLERALDDGLKTGLPTGWRYPEGGESYYHMSLWRAPHKSIEGCRKIVPYMSGYGGNYVLLLPNNMVAIRFADGGYNDDDTWDNWDMRNVADSIRSFCKSH